MKIEGLGDERRATLFQIRTMVEGVDGFSGRHFDRMIEDYKKEDPIMHKVLNEAQRNANSNYTRYLNGLICGGKMGLNLMGLENFDGEGTVMGKVMHEMRESLKSEKDYRAQFLAPEIGRQIQQQEIQLRKAQKEEIKKQREESRALARSQRKGFRSFDFGL